MSADATDPAHSPPPIPDHELLGLIGRGSYGEVWLARNVMGTYRAVKVVYRRTFESDRPFEREFAGIEKFEPISRSHEGLVQVLHVGRSPQDGFFYYVMELADDADGQPSAGRDPNSGEGGLDSELIAPATYTPRTLRSEIQRKGRLPFEQLLPISLTLAAALGHLHQGGLLHRDLKPSNIIFVHGRPKIADIGLVSELGESRSFVGTEGFIPPEGPGTPQADLYSLGKVLYEASTGKDRLAFPEIPAEWLETPEQDGHLEFHEVVLKACEGRAEKRYQRAEDMQADLAVLQSGKSLQRLRRVERRLALATRAIVAATVLAAVALGGYLVQQAQSRKFQKLAEANRRLAEEKQNDLVRMYVDNGQRLLEEGDNLGALPWYANALAMVRGDPAKETEHRLRLAGIFQQSPRLLHLWRHEAAVNSAEFSPNGRWIVTASRDQTARVWDALTGQPISPPLLHTSEVARAIFSPDGRQVVTIGKGTRLWEAQSGKLLRADPHPLRSLAGTPTVFFSPDKKWLAVGSDYGGIKVWDFESGLELVGPWQQWHFAKWSVTALAFSPDSRRLFSTAWNATSVLWDLELGTSLFELKHDARVGSAEFNADGSRLLTAEFKAQVWDAHTGQPVLPAWRHGEWIYSAIFSPEGSRVVSAGFDRTARIWNANNGQLGGPILAHYRSVLEARFTSDGQRVLTRDAGGTVHLWDAQTGQPVIAPLPHGGLVRSTVLHPDGRRLLTACEDGSVRLWDVQTSPPAWFTKPEPFWIMALSGTGDRFVTQTTNHVLQVWDAISWKPVSVPLTFSNVVATTLLSRDRTRLTVLEPRTADWGGPFTFQVRDLPSGRLLWALPLQGHVFSYGCDADATSLIRVQGDAVQPCGERDGAPQWGPVRFGETIRIGEVIFSPDGQRLLLPCVTAMHLLDPRTGRELTPPMPLPNLTQFISFSPDGRWIVAPFVNWSLEAGAARLWDASTGRLAALLPHNQSVWYASFSPDSRRVATASHDLTARVWDVPSGRPLSPPLRHAAEIVRTSFSPDGRWLATITWDGRIYVWNWESGTMLVPPIQQEREVEQLQFLADGRTLYAKSQGAPAHFWRLPQPTATVEDTLTLAALLSGHQIDGRGEVVSVNADRLTEHFAALRQKMPEMFRPVNSLSPTGGEGRGEGAPRPRVIAPRLIAASPAPTVVLTNLLNQPAPDFKLARLDGSSLDFTALRGTNVVILHFWTTWSGPSRRALPLLADVAREYSARGVVLCAVNVLEPPETIRARAMELGLDSDPLLDPDGEVARRYGVTGVPVTLLIGHDGRVSRVDTGFRSDFRMQLEEDLAALFRRDVSGQ